MAYRLAYLDGFGDGSSGDLTPNSKNTVINHYAQITALGKNTVTVGNVTDAAKFTVGSHVLLHCSAYTGSQSTFPYLGRWYLTRITAVSGNVFTVKKDVHALAGGASLNEALCQMILMPQFKTLTLNANCSISPPQFDRSKGYGGILALKCSVELFFNSGHIDLTGRGLPDYSIRGVLPQELHGTVDDSYAGQENTFAPKNLPINCPDGAAFLAVKNMTMHDKSRIGNVNSSGSARFLGMNDNSNDNVRVGGSSILIAAENIDNFNPACLSKFSSQKGLTAGGFCRCYIATESVLPNDEGLYASDRISDPERLSRECHVKSFGDGSDGAKTNYTGQLNNYAKVTKIDTTRKIFTTAGMTVSGLAKFKVGALVMIHANHNAKGYYPNAGRFSLATIIGLKSNVVTVDSPFPDDGNVTAANYDIQIITVPQFTDFTLQTSHTSTPKFADGQGGILALAVKGTCDLSDGKLNVMKKGCPYAYGERGLNYISNAQMATKLPIGQGHGSVFILANNLIMNTNTRIGATYRGSDFGGGFYGKVGDSGWNSVPDPATYWAGYGGGGGKAHSPGLKTDDGSAILSGGFGGNGDDGNFGSRYPESGSAQGAHIFIAANKITGLNLNALSTGGMGSSVSGDDQTNFRESKGWVQEYENFPGAAGGCGFGGSSGYNTCLLWEGRTLGHINFGGYHGGGAPTGKEGKAVTDGGGAGAFCFVYCNEEVDQDLTNMFP